MATKKKFSKKPTPRNEFGRTETEQGAWEKLCENLTGIMSGELKVSACGYTTTPINLSTNKPFTGRNYFLALLSSMVKGDNRYVSAKDAIDRGWQIKGTKQEFFLRPISVKKDKDIEDDEDNVRTFFKAYGLINLADIEHDLNTPADGVVLENESELLDQILDTIDKNTKLSRLPITAHVVPSSGEINIPPASAFFSVRKMISTCLHEMSHFIAIGSETIIEYSKYRGFEEITAEITALLCGAKLGLQYEPKNMAYINSWLTHAKTTHTDPLEKAFSEAITRSEKVLKMIDATKHLSYSKAA